MKYQEFNHYYLFFRRLVKSRRIAYKLACMKVGI